jgi:hypothetical protein
MATRTAGMVGVGPGAMGNTGKGVAAHYIESPISKGLPQINGRLTDPSTSSATFPPGRVGSVSSSSGLGMTDEQSTRVLRSLPRAASLAIAVRKAVLMSCGLSASSCQRQEVLRVPFSQGFANCVEEAIPWVTSNSEIGLHAELSGERGEDLSEANGRPRVQNPLEQCLNEKLSVEPMGGRVERGALHRSRVSRGSLSGERGSNIRQSLGSIRVDRRWSARPTGQQSHWH